MKGLLNWYAERPEREQRILLLGGGLSLLLILVFGIWLPLEDAIEREQNRHRALQQALLTMQHQAAEIRTLRGAGLRPATPGDGQRSLISILEEAVTEAGLKSSLKRMEPDGQKRIRLQFSSVSFDQLVLLLDRLTRGQDMRIASFNITPTSKPGRVDARLVLAR
ncbi:MAG: type II secretion system protein M [Gammaproteobacteria bacterium]|nr:MAG: type II secretion system protein M [Gammaproteobacteria bacterium]